jgi:hypothetical protein
MRIKMKKLLVMFVAVLGLSVSASAHSEEVEAPAKAGWCNVPQAMADLNGLSNLGLSVRNSSHHHIRDAGSALYSSSSRFYQALNYGDWSGFSQLLAQVQYDANVFADRLGRDLAVQARNLVWDLQNNLYCY